MKRLRYLSLFSGIGGFDRAFDRAGMVCAGQVEYDAKCRDVLARHWPDVPRLNDVREVNGDEFGAIGLVCGGFPCQDVSVAGRRTGLAGERSGLWFEFHRIVDSVRPRWVVVENVPGLLSSNGGRDFAVILRGLVKCGYGVAWRILDAQYFGVAQRRRRVFIVGSLGDRGRAAEVLFERESGAGDSGPRRQKGAEFARGVAASPRASSGGGRPNDAETGLIVAATLNSGGNTGGFRTEPGEHIVAVPRVARQAKGAFTDPVNDNIIITTTFNGYTGGADDNDAQGGHLVAATLNSVNSGGFRMEPGEHIVFDWQSGGDVRHNVSDRHTSALQASQTPATLGAFGVRRLTPIECERLQGFPDGFTGGQSDSTRYRQLGNAVAVPVAEWIGRRIVEASR